MALTSRPPVRPTSTPRAEGMGLDLALGLGFGALAGTAVLGLPLLLVLGLVAALGGLVVMASTNQVELWGRYLLIATAFVQPMNGRYHIPLPIADAMLLVTLSAFIVIRLRSGSGGVRSPQRAILACLGLLAAGGLIGAFFEAPGVLMYQGTAFPLTDVTGWDWNRDAFIAFTVGSIVPIALWALVRPTRAMLRQVLGAFVAGCTVSVLAAYVIPSPTAGGRIAGLAVHALQLGSISMVGFGAATALILNRRSYPTWGYVALPVLAWGVIASGSRSALGGLVVFGLIVGPLTRRRDVMGMVLVGIALVIVLVVGGLFQGGGEDAIGRTIGTETADNSSSLRADLARRVWDRWELRPITGNGFNHMRPAHNIYLGTLASAGVLGVLGLGGIITTIVRRAWRRREDMLAVGVTAALLAYFVSAYFDYLLWWRWLWFMVGAAIAVLSTRPSSSETALVPQEART